MKLVKILSSVAILAALFTTSGHAQSPIIRVAAGVDNSGSTRYIEAFEYDYVTEKPCFPGGEGKLYEFINHEREYPTEAYERGIQGKVTCWFIVNPDGSISNVTLYKSVNELLNEEALRIFSQMPAWEPGRMNGKAVPVRVVRSIRFRK